jgi:hypothetical protein
MKRLKRALRAIGILIGTVVGATALSNFTEGLFSNAAVSVMSLARYGTLSDHVVDSNGIPRVRYHRLDAHPRENPVYVSVYALYYYDNWIDNGENDYFLQFYRIFPPRVSSREQWKHLFLNAAEWLKKRSKIRRHGDIEYAVYEYDFPWQIYRLNPPWRSAMAQGLAMQVFLRAWLCTGDSEYLRWSNLARNTLLIEVSQGGVTYKLNDSHWWYEEYAAPDAIPSYVLNGMLHVLIALREHTLLTNDTLSDELLKKGLNALRSKLNAYYSQEIGWTYYDALGNLANYKYHHININLLARLHSLTSDQSLSVWQTWSQSSASFIWREFVVQVPNYIDWVIITLNYICVVAFYLFMRWSSPVLLCIRRQSR